MAIELECSICGQEHRFRDEHSGRQTHCKECSARIDIPREGLGGILDGTTPVLTPPVVIFGGLILSGVVIVAVWEFMSSFGSGPPMSASPVAAAPRQPATPLPHVSASPIISQPPVASPPANVNQAPVGQSSLPNRPIVTAPARQPPAPNAVASVQRSLPGPKNESEKMRDFYLAVGTPLVRFMTPENQPVQIQEIVPAWAAPGQAVVLRGRGLSKTIRVVAIDNLRFQEHELPYRIISDGELSFDAPPAIERRNESVFVFEVYSAEGVAVTLPRELLEAKENSPVLGDFGIIRNVRASVVLSAFALVDESGSIESVNSARVYLLKPTLPQRFEGVVAKIFHTKEAVVESAKGPKVESVLVPAIFLCYLDKLFAGPECRSRRFRDQ